MARNNSIKFSSGTYIAFLDSDDIWLPQKLEKQLSFMRNQNIDFSFTSYKLIDENGRDIGKRVVAKPVVGHLELLRSNYIGCSTAIYNVANLGKIYMPDILKRQDYGLWYNIVKNHCDARGLNEDLTLYRISSNSVSSSKFGLLKYNWMLYRNEFKLTFFSSIKSLIYCIIYSIFKIKDRGL